MDLKVLLINGFLISYTDKNGNYFAKVFKKYTGKSPNVYRNARSSMPVNHWFTN